MDFAVVLSDFLFRSLGRFCFFNHLFMRSLGGVCGLVAVRMYIVPPPPLLSAPLLSLPQCVVVGGPQQYSPSSPSSPRPPLYDEDEDEDVKPIFLFHCR